MFGLDKKMLIYIAVGVFLGLFIFPRFTRLGG